MKATNKRAKSAKPKRPAPLNCVQRGAPLFCESDTTSNEINATAHITKNSTNSAINGVNFMNFLRNLKKLFYLNL